MAYLHEGLEPKVVHRDIKSSNILLDRQWNAKVSDFGLAKLLGSDSSYITTRVMGTFGYMRVLPQILVNTFSPGFFFQNLILFSVFRYVAPEYASTGMLNERSDVYSFGILMMELLTGRNPVEYDRAPDEVCDHPVHLISLYASFDFQYHLNNRMVYQVNLVEWLKKMVSNKNAEGVLDPKLPELPNTRALKRALLVALRCVDLNAQKRPRMGHVIHMLEAEDSFKDVSTKLLTLLFS